MAKKILLLVVAFAVLGFFGWRTYIDQDGIRYVVTFKSCSPDDLRYDEFGPYCLGVIESKHASGRQCRIKIVNAANTLPHGAGYTTNPTDGPCAKFTSADWTKDGVTANFEGGAATFAKDTFTGAKE